MEHKADQKTLSILSTPTRKTSTSSSGVLRTVILGFGASVLLFLNRTGYLFSASSSPCLSSKVIIPQASCPAQSLSPSTSWSDKIATNIEELFNSVEYRDLVAGRLSGAVKIPCITYDEMDPLGVDPRWEVFYEMNKYLEGTFSTIYKKLTVETVNEHALLYTWNGSDPSLKPLLFMAHTDVVPVPNDTISRWTYPPFSGHYDGTYIWGRGSEDDKSNLIAMLSAFTTLLEMDFKPQRTVILAVGFDEEGGATEQGYGARGLSELLLGRYGPDSIELIFDEGIPGIEKHFGTNFALPATAEKGYIDATVSVDTEGGHSSTPPDHTAIGYLADIILAIESNPFPSSLSGENPIANYLSCLAEYGNNVPKELRDSILDPKRGDEVLKYMDGDRERRALVRTSSAVDVVYGGSKANNLPESAHILINHRIAIDSSVQAVKQYYINLLTPFAKSWNFTLNPFISNTTTIPTTDNSQNSITLLSSTDLEPSPISSTTTPQFSILTSTIRSVFGPETIVAPTLLSGNTDTKYYWDLSKDIYRWSPWVAEADPRGSRMHTVDERMPVVGLLEMWRFYVEFVGAVDGMR